MLISAFERPVTISQIVKQRGTKSSTENAANCAAKTNRLTNHLTSIFYILEESQVKQALNIYIANIPTSRYCCVTKLRTMPNLLLGSSRDAFAF